MRYEDFDPTPEERAEIDGLRRRLERAHRVAWILTYVIVGLGLIGGIAGLNPWGPLASWWCYQAQRQQDLAQRNANRVLNAEWERCDTLARFGEHETALADMRSLEPEINDLTHAPNGYKKGYITL